MAQNQNLPIPSKYITAPDVAENFVPVTGSSDASKNSYHDPSYPNAAYPYPVWRLGTPVLRQAAKAIPTKYLDLADSAPVIPWSTNKMYQLAQLLANSIGDGNGIAANQVGLLWRMFIVRTKALQNMTPSFPIQYPAPLIEGTDETHFSSDPNAETYQIFINPCIPEKEHPNQHIAFPTWNATEGCLSIPDYTGNVPSDSTKQNVVVPRLIDFTISYTTLTFLGADYTPTLQAISPIKVSTKPVQQAVGQENPANWVLQHEYDHLAGKLYIDTCLFTDPTTGKVEPQNPTPNANSIYLDTMKTSATLYGGTVFNEAS